jgi:hypothetical protein
VARGHALRAVRSIPHISGNPLAVQAQILKILYDYGTTLARAKASDEMESKNMKLMIENHTRGQVLCPICTHTVPAEVDLKAKSKYARVSQGQRCPRCGSSLDVAVVIEVPQAA